MANPKGFPQNLKPITTDRVEPLIYRVQIRIAKSLYDELNALEDKAEFS